MKRQANTRQKRKRKNKKKTRTRKDNTIMKEHKKIKRI